MDYSSIITYDSFGGIYLSKEAGDRNNEQFALDVDRYLLVLGGHSFYIFRTQAAEPRKRLLGLEPTAMDLVGHVADFMSGDVVQPDRVAAGHHAALLLRTEGILLHDSFTQSRASLVSLGIPVHSRTVLLDIY